ncbi:MAG TPA: hypothetical protein VI979_00305 [archaeon]|nr:hypothetical protein [archaeon]
MKQFVAEQNIHYELRGALMQICGNCELYGVWDFQIIQAHRGKYINVVMHTLDAGNVSKTGASHILGHDRDCFYNALKGRYKN